MTVYYNEIDPYCVEWLEALMAEKLIASGHVDSRSIKEVEPADLKGYSQCHFFAGLGGWSYALRLAGWPDDAPVWSGSCPCQPFSHAGKRKGTSDHRHLWPDWFRIIRQCRPSIVFGEQVESKDGYEWLAGVQADLEGTGYAVGRACLPAAGVAAPHARHRLWFVAHAEPKRSLQPAGRQVAAEPDEDGPEQRLSERGSGSRIAHADDAGRSQHGGTGAGESPCVAAKHGGGVEHATGERRGEGWAEPEFRSGWTAVAEHGGLGDAESIGWRGRPNDEDGGRWQRPPGHTNPWSDAEWLWCEFDQRWRRVEPGIRLLAHGLPQRVAKLRALGNAIVPQVAAEFITAGREALEI